ncbi:hypothetical protein [Sandaracinus amylolyticus]|uniref:hypothetical protein n=1 Tax=Sandaracinus amylolyticus TaxID=927083 RepID=UPI001F43C6AC|nr:hypothetical protein [Sandaracinus amylolyticus]UJR82649.1 Hypothetical protein I5071_47140 [Sandaracinus amylolyticus]
MRPFPLVLVPILALVGCGGATATAIDPPEPAVRAYAEALARGDAAGSYAMELETAHRDRDVGAQRARFEDARGELAEVGRALASAPAEATRAHARIALANGETVVLARDSDGGWRIEGGVLGVPALVEPRDAVIALRSALARRDLRGIEEVLAQRTRAAWEAEVARVLEQTDDEDALRVTVDGERAFVRTPGGIEIELAREGEEWRVVDVRPAP